MAMLVVLVVMLVIMMIMMMLVIVMLVIMLVMVTQNRRWTFPPTLRLRGCHSGPTN